MSEKNPPRIILHGDIPVSMLNALAETFEKWCPSSFALDSQHPFSREHNATLCFVSKDDPALKENEIEGQ